MTTSTCHRSVSARVVTRSLMFVASLVMAAVPVSAGILAQASAPITTDAGVTIAWEAPWYLDTTFVEPASGFDAVSFSDGVASLTVASLPGSYDIDSVRDGLLVDLDNAGADAITIDRSAYGSVSYSLDLLKVDPLQTGIGVFTLIKAGGPGGLSMAYLFASEAHSFGSGFESAQSSFVVNGEGIFNGVEGSGLQAQLEDNLDPSFAGPATEAPTEEDRSETTSESEQLGLVSSTRYVSPQYDHELTWSGDWEVDPWWPDPIVSDSSAGVDLITLAWTDTGAIWVMATFLTFPGQTLTQVVDYLSSEGRLSFELGDDAELVVSESRAQIGGLVTTFTARDGTQVVLYEEVRLLDDGSYAIIQFWGDPAAVTESLPEATEGILLNGEPILNLFSAEDVLDDPSPNSI